MHCCTGKTCNAHMRMVSMQVPCTGMHGFPPPLHPPPSPPTAACCDLASRIRNAHVAFLTAIGCPEQGCKERMTYKLQATPTVAYTQHIHLTHTHSYASTGHETHVTVCNTAMPHLLCSSASEARTQGDHDQVASFRHRPTGVTMEELL